MRFVAFEKDGKKGLALESAEGRLTGLTQDAADWPGDLDELIRSGALGSAAQTLKAAGEIDRQAITITLPFRRAGKLLCVGLNYADHAKESAMEAPSFPTVFVRFNSNLVPHDGQLVRPDASDQFDFEGELVAVIGKAGSAIAKENALDHVAGYTIFNDGSIRDFQLRTNQWTIGKNFDNTGALGPCFVTADELPAGAAGLRLTTRLNGDIMQDATTDDLMFSVADLVSHLSVGMTLQPGDLIATGTPSGVGFAREPKVFMKPGDHCEIEIEKIGRLHNRIVAA